MNKFTNPLSNIRIASPCQTDWNQMIGDERRRFCGSCNLNVYNLSEMTRAEAENLLINSEGRLCARFYKRVDGTVLTKDCPVGWQLLKKRASKTAAAFASLIFGVLTSLGLTALFNQSNRGELMGTVSVENSDHRTMGVIAYRPTLKQTPTPKQTPELLMGDIAMPPPPAPAPKQRPKPKNTEVVVGRIALEKID